MPESRIRTDTAPRTKIGMTDVAAAPATNSEVRSCRLDQFVECEYECQGRALVSRHRYGPPNRSHAARHGQEPVSTPSGQCGWTLRLLLPSVRQHRLGACTISPSALPKAQ